MIVKDEEQFLDKCLQSVKGIVNEIIVVDTGSTDRTIEIAKLYGAKVYSQEWKKDFALARNYSIEMATSDYILVLDADEYIQEFDLGKYIKEERDFYFIHIKNYMSEEYVTYHQAIRLFKNNRGLHYFGKIHEHLNIEEIKGLTAMQTELTIHHTGYQKETYVDKDKMKRNFEILESETLNNPTGYNFFNFGMQYKVSQDYEKALETFKKSYYLSKDQIYLSYLLYQMGDCLFHLSQYKEAIEFLNDAIKMFPMYTGYYFLLGHAYEEIGYLKDAEYCYKRCLDLGEVKDFQTIEGVGSYLANIKLSANLQKQGNLLKALEPAFQAVQEKKYFVPGIAQYINVLMGSRIQTNEMISNLQSIYPVNEIKDLSTIAGVLYNKRSSVLLHYINSYNIEVSENIKAVAHQYAGNLEIAFEIWKVQQEIKEENCADLIAFCIATRNIELFSSINPYATFSKEEIFLLEAWIKRDKNVPSFNNGSISKEIQLVLQLLVKIMDLKELEYFYLLDNRNYRYTFLTILMDSGLLEEALQLIQKEMDVKKNNEFLHLLGQICFRTNRMHDAISVLNLLYEQDQSYETHLALYNFYEKLGDQEGMKTLSMEMQEVFPLSWDNFR